jgi:hypothetical protein
MLFKVVGDKREVTMDSMTAVARTPLLMVVLLTVSIATNWLSDPLLRLTFVLFAFMCVVVLDCALVLSSTTPQKQDQPEEESAT